MNHYNIFALQGDTSVTDADVCEQLGLDPKLAGTPAINDAAIKQMHKDNYQAYLSAGSSDADAQSMADHQASAARTRVAEAMTNRNK